MIEVYENHSEPGDKQICAGLINPNVGYIMGRHIGNEVFIECVTYHWKLKTVSSVEFIQDESFLERFSNCENKNEYLNLLEGIFEVQTGESL